MPIIKDASRETVDVLRERCRAIGLASWRCDSNGVVLAEPEESGPIALLLGTTPVTRLIGDACKRWAGEREPIAAEMSPGWWLIPLVEQRRRDRTGYVVLLGMTAKALDGELYLEACRAAQVDVQATRSALLPRAGFDERSAGAIGTMVSCMAEDLARLEDHGQTVTGFTKQLTDSFETIDLLYGLGRSMSDLTQPELFVTTMCARLRATLGFGWIGAWLSPNDRLGPRLAGRFYLSGTPSVDTGPLPALVTDMMDTRPRILVELNGRPVPGSGQVLMHPVGRSGRVVGALYAGDKAGDDPQISSYDIQLLEAASGYVGAFLDNAALYADQQQLFFGTLEALTASIDAKDRYTCGHSRRVAHLSWQLALACGSSPEQAERVRIAGLVHDVGKIGVPEAVLGKQGRLTDEEFGLIKLHPEIGHRILRDIRLLGDVLPGVLHHHERWDGKGYPHGIAGEQIPKIARFISLADTFDAMSSTRSYREAMPREKVLAELRRSAGTQLDPDLAAVFVGLDFTQYDRLVAQHASEPTGGYAIPQAAIPPGSAAGVLGQAKAA